MAGVVDLHVASQESRFDEHFPAVAGGKTGNL